MAITINEGYNQITLTGTFPTTFELSRQYPGGLPVLLTDELALPDPIDPANYDDYNAIYGREALYTVVANGATVHAYVVGAATQVFSGAYLHKVSRGPRANIFESEFVSATLLHLNNQEGSNREISVASEVLHLPAYDKPIIEVSQTVQRIWRIPLILPSLTDGTREILNGWIEEHAVLCCRDDRGRRMFGIMQKVRESLDLSGFYPFELWECDYREGFRL
jgi:hypothetical protein